MAKNMQDTAYRKLDVDAFDPDKFDENQDDGIDTPGLGPDEKTIQNYLSSNRLDDALHAALTNPPLKTKNQVVKNKSTEVVSRVLGAFKTGDIPAAVKNLSDEEGDLLMKYVYKVMELYPDSALCQTVLVWHAQLVSRFGLGCIIRVLSDRRRL